MTALAEVAPKIARVMRLLGSDKDGEVVAAVHAIGRTLAGAGLDWHALAGAIGRAGLEDETRITDWHSAVMWIWRHRMGLLRPREQDFIEDMAARPASWFLTPRQRDWLQAIADRVGYEP